MQTFLPYPSYEKSANVLDQKRLWKQLVEGLQILDTLVTKKSHSCFHCSRTVDNPEDIGDTCVYGYLSKHKWQITPWYNHPAVKMWKGYEQSLLIYIENILVANKKRNSHIKLDKTIESYHKLAHIIADSPQYKLESPWWLGYDKFHQSHRANLLRKNYDYYIKYFNEDLTTPYWWPSEHLDEQPQPPKPLIVNSILVSNQIINEL